MVRIYTDIKRFVKILFALIILSLACSISYGQSYIWQGSVNQFTGQLGGLGSNKWFLLPNDTLKFTSALREDGLLAYKLGTVYVYDSAGCSCYKALANASGAVYTAGFGLVLVANQFSVDTAQIATQFDLTQLGGNYIQNQNSTKQSANYSIISGRQDSVIINTPTSMAAPNDKWVLKNFFNRTTGAGDTVGARLGFYYTSNDLAQHKLGFFGGGGSFVLPGHALDEIAHSTGYYAGDYDQSSSTPFGLVMWCANRVCSLGYNFNTGYNLTSTHNKAAIYFDSLFRFTTIGLDNYESDMSGSYTSRSKIDKGYADGRYALTTIPWHTVMTNGNVTTVSQRTGLMTAPTTNPTMTESSTTEFLGRQALNNIYWFSSNNATAGGNILNVTRARDTTTNTALASGDDIFSMQLRGTDGNSASAVLGFAFLVETPADWSPTNRSTQMIISNTATGSTAQVRAIRLTDHDIFLGETGVKNVIVGTTTNSLNSRLKVAGTTTSDSIRSTLFTGQIPKTTADGVFVPATAGTDYIAGGTGTANTVAKFTASGTIGNSNITDNGTIVAINSKATHTAGTLANGEKALAATATMPASPAGAAVAYDFTVTGNGSAAQNNRGMLFTYGAGYTGNAKSMAAEFDNFNASTGNDLQWTTFGTNPTGNSGLNAFAIGVTTGLNNAGYYEAYDGNLNVGIFAKSTKAKNSATNIGIIGQGNNTGSSPVHVGGWFTLAATAPTYTSAALVADNGATTSPIALFRDNGSTVASVTDGGTLNTQNVEPLTDDTYYLGENSSTTPHAYKGVILKDTTNGNYYRIEVVNGVITATAL